VYRNEHDDYVASGVLCLPGGELCTTVFEVKQLLICGDLDLSPQVFEITMYAGKPFSQVRHVVVTSALCAVALIGALCSVVHVVMSACP
jgi:hypothetical protein